MKPRIFGALELGSSKICLLIGFVSKQSTVSIFGPFEVPSKGIRKGIVTDLKQASAALKECYGKALAIVKYPIEDILLAQSGKHLRSFEHSSTRTISSANNRVTEEDIQYVQKEAKNKHLLPEELYIHHFFQNFRIDDNLCEQPFDKEGKNLTVEYCSLFGRSDAIKDSIYLVNQTGCKVKELIFSGLASSSVVAMPSEKENGVCVLDIGAETTDYIVYKRNKVVLSGSIPIGGMHFTHDICSGLHLHFEDAENLKRKEGIPEGDEAYLEEKFWAIGNASIGDKMLKRKTLKIILEARAEELFESIYGLWQKIGTDIVPPLTILTGGCSELKNIEQVAGKILQTDICKRKPLYKVDTPLQSPTYSTCLGLLHYALQPFETKAASSHSLWSRFTKWLNV